MCRAGLTSGRIHPAPLAKRPASGHACDTSTVLMAVVVALPPVMASALDARFGEPQCCICKCGEMSMGEALGPSPGQRSRILYPTPFLTIVGAGQFGEAELMSASKDVWAEPKDADEDDEVRKPFDASEFGSECRSAGLSVRSRF